MLSLRKIYPIALTLIICVLIAVGCAPDRTEITEDGRIILEYWEKWGGFEADAMRVIVNDYNESQTKYFVRYVADAGAQIDRKLMVSIAGGNPPDISGFWDDRLVSYVQNGALTPLDKYMKRDGINPDRYVPNIIEACRFEGYTWGLPTTPATLALFYNREMFREAGLDPDTPPKTIAQLTEYSRKITKKDEEGKLIQVGFHPDIPHWWNSRWPVWFGGDVWDENGNIVVDSPENVACYEWIGSLYKEYGLNEMDKLRAASDNFDSPQWPFFSGRVAMVIQGVWTPNFIERHSPELDWAAAPFPTLTEEMKDTTIVSNDILVIPRGCPNPEGAWDFLKYVQRQENIEKLNLLQKKFSPLKEVSESFYEQHENKAIKLFRRLAESPNAIIAPKVASFWEMQAEMNDVFYRAKLGDQKPLKILQDTAPNLQVIYNKADVQWERVADERRKMWEDW